MAWPGKQLTARGFISIKQPINRDYMIGTGRFCIPAISACLFVNLQNLTQIE